MFLNLSVTFFDARPKTERVMNRARLDRPNLPLAVERWTATLSEQSG